MRTPTATIATVLASALAVTVVTACGSDREVNGTTPARIDASATATAVTTAPPPKTAPATTATPRTVPSTPRPSSTLPRRTLPADTVRPTIMPRRTLPVETVRPTTARARARPTTMRPTTTSTVPPVVAAPAEVLSEGDRLGSIEIPRIGLSRSMVEGIELSTLDDGPGHWPGTAMPGEVGNVVVAGHRVSHNADFRNLDQLSPGDEVIFNSAGGRHVYAVASTEIVQPDAVWIVDQTVEATATLFACHPPGSVSQRIVVHLQLAG